MANEAYICRIDTTLSAGIVQITDLRPNTSRRSLTYDKVPQSGYLPARVENDAVTGNTAANATTSALSGLAAYLVDVLDQGAGAAGNGISEAMADSIAAAIIGEADAGNALGKTEIDAQIVGAATPAAAGTTIDAGGSQGSVADVLKILAGGSYTVPTGTQVNGGAAYKGSADGSFDDDGYRQIYQSGALTMSVSEGDLAQHIADGYCTVYDDAGAVLS